MEQGLRRVIAEKKDAPPFKLCSAAFKRNGLRPGLRDASWETLREKAYEGRGG